MKIKEVALKIFARQMALFMVFLILKLTGIVTWSWLVITLPLWGVYVTILLTAVMAAIAITLIYTIGFFFGII